jgi:hypothetical protein
MYNRGLAVTAELYKYGKRYFADNYGRDFACFSFL